MEEVSGFDIRGVRLPGILVAHETGKFYWHHRSIRRSTRVDTIEEARLIVLGWHLHRRFGLRLAPLDHARLSLLGLSEKEAHLGWIYFIGDDNGNIKIGKAKDPTRRMSSLRSATAGELSLLGVMPGYSLLEEQLHFLFDGFRVRGEWFSDCVEVRQFIAQYCNQLPIELWP